MTLADNYVPESSPGNGSTTIFTFPWDALSASYVKVYFEEILTGIQTPQTTGFVVTLNATGIGGNVEFTTAPTSAYNVIIAREVTDDQITTYKTSTGIDTKVLENNFDKRTAVSQQQQDAQERSLTLALGTSGVSAALPAPVSDTYLGWNTAGTAIENKPEPVVTEVEYNGVLGAGLDANKPVAPNVNDQYFATDVNIKYVCLTTGVWTYNGVFDGLQAGAVICDSILTDSFQIDTSPEIDGILTGSDSTSTSDSKLVTAGYVATQLKSWGAYETTDANQVGGSTTTLAVSTDYTASVDGQVTAYSPDDGTVSLLVGASTPSSTIVADQEPSVSYGAITGIVAAGEHWSVTGAGSGLIRFKPFTA